MIYEEDYAYNAGKKRDWELERADHGIQIGCERHDVTLGLKTQRKYLVSVAEMCQNSPGYLKGHVEQP